MSNVLEWKETNGVGPTTYYGFWDGAKCFSVFLELKHKGASPAKYCIKSILPGFRPDLPLQNSVTEAQAFCERMLERWVAKRGLLFKNRIVVTDAMKHAALAAFKLPDDKPYMLNPGDITQSPFVDAMGRSIEAALKAREPHAAQGNKK